MSERNYWQRMRRRQMSRRALLGASARAGVGAAGLALVGCGDDDDDQQQTAAQVQQQQVMQQDDAQQQADMADQQDTADQPQQDQPTQTVSAAPAGIMTGGRRIAPFVGPYSGDPPTLDPYENLTYRAQIPSAFHYSKLMQAITGGDGVDPGNTAQYENDLAASMPEIPDETTYVFTVREDANWHDVDPLNGRAITQADIVATHDRFQELETANNASWNDVIASMTPGEDNSLTFKLHEPHAPFFTLIGSSQHLWIIPQEIVDSGTVAQRPVGSGPWIFENFEPGVAINWRRNPDWHRSRDYVNGSVDGHGGGYNGIAGADPQMFPLMDGVTATMNGDTNVLIPSLGDGALDFSQLSPAIYKQAVEAAPQIEDNGFVFTLNTVPGGFYFNYSIAPWNDVRVRLALSMSLDRDGILSATDDTGRGAWHSPLSQIAPYWMDPKDLDTFGATYEGEDSGLTFHRDLAKARQLLDAAGYPEGIQATLHGTADYGATVVNLYEACAASAAEAGFQFEFFFKEYAAYIASIFRGNFPDDWDGESSHLAIGPLYGGATDPHDIWAAVYARTSGRHNWGSGGRTPDGLASVMELDTGGNAESWSHANAVSGGGPENDERLHEMFATQKGLLDFEERLEYTKEIQRYMSTKQYMVPYVAAPGVYAFNPWMQQVDPRNGELIDNPDKRVWPKANYGWGAECEPFFMLNQDIKDEYA